MLKNVKVDEVEVEEKDMVPKVKHVREIDGDIQRDYFTVKIPVDICSDKGANTLFSWAIEEFDRAVIDWKSRTIILDYKTIHYLPEGYVEKDLEEEF